MEFIQNNPEEALDVLMPYYNIDIETLSTYIYDSGIVYEAEIKGIETFVDFMYRNEYIKENYKEDELIW